METSRSPTAVPSEPPDDPTQVVTPAPSPCQSHNLLDNQKTGAVLLFSGVFLLLVGVTFTTMGWHHYQTSPNFEWTQLLGPILISVGSTFMFVSVCKFEISCLPCTQLDKDMLVMPVMEQTSAGHSFMLNGINQPIMLRNGTAMLCIPPQYNYITQEARHAIEFQPGGSVSGICAACPPRDAVYCVDNRAFTAEEEDGGSARCTETDRRRSRFEKTEDERGCGDEGGATCSPPPAYEDIYPSFNNHSLM